ncbi:hypothetical protein [Elioraea sp.]|uniref:hypothetical protein n=1 Tax=Elioraea sp. TaxID=2185103 RepID=UPI0025BCD3F9|nr:hypothetical protein [Elioraea sp.]
MPRGPAICLLALSLATPAFAQTLRDDASGISITAPPGYTATPSPPGGTPRPVFDLRTPRDTDTGCRIAVEGASATASLTQAEINARNASPEHTATVAATYGTVYDIRVVEPVTHQGITGIAMIGDLKPRPAMPPRAQDVRSLLVILETPRLRVSLGCVGEKADFASRLAGFEAVLKGLAIP